MKVAVGVLVNVAINVWVKVAVSVFVNVTDGVRVEVTDGVNVDVGVFVGVDVAVTACDGMYVRTVITSGLTDNFSAYMNHFPVAASLNVAGLA